MRSMVEGDRHRRNGGGAGQPLHPSPTRAVPPTALWEGFENAGHDLPQPTLL